MVTVVDSTGGSGSGLMDDKVMGAVVMGCIVDMVDIAGNGCVNGISSNGCGGDGNKCNGGVGNEGNGGV